MTRHLVSTMLVIVGVIHLLPLSGVLGGARLEALYGIPVGERDLAIAWSVGGYNAALGRVVTADLVALACLIVASVALWSQRGAPSP